MSLTTVLFDLDGTLLPMDQDRFIEAYFKGLVGALIPLGYDPKKAGEAVWTGTMRMIQNDGSRPNEEVFWETFCGTFGQEARGVIPHLEQFYRTDFERVQAVCGYDPSAASTVEALKEMGLTVALATNPVFPAVATEARIRWAGLGREDFAHVTAYENSRYAKPNTDYYRDLCATLGVRPEECLMVGNDVEEDMIARTLGMRVFLVTHSLINRKERDPNAYPHGSLTDLLTYVKSIHP